MNKSTIIILAIIGLLLGSTVILSLVVKNQRTELDRLESNQSALLDSMVYYKAENDQNAASVQILQLSKSELEKSYADLTSQVTNLGIKLKRAEAIAQAGIITKVEIKTIVRDSIVYRDRNPDSLKVVQWSDPWTDFKGILKDDKLTANINCRDTLTAVVHRTKKCLFKKAEYRMDITSSNPHSSITYERAVKVTK